MGENKAFTQLSMQKKKETTYVTYSILSLANKWGWPSVAYNTVDCFPCHPAIFWASIQSFLFFLITSKPFLKLRPETQ